MLDSTSKQAQTAQQTIIGGQNTQGRASQVQESQSQPKTTVEAVKEIAKEAKNNGTEINSKAQVEELVSQLNKALSPISTSISFSVDQDNIFFVAVNETESNRLLRRFPAEQAADFLPKMQEVTGILFDTKG